MQKVFALLLISHFALTGFSQTKAGAALGNTPTKSTTKKQVTNYKLTVHGVESSNMILAFYSGDKQYVKDTVLIDAKGVATIKADTALPGGIYLAVFPKLGNKYFEFIVNEPAFQLETDTNELSGNMKVTGSLENKLFYDDMKFLATIRKTSDSLEALYKSTEDAAKKDKLKSELTKIQESVKNARLAIVKNNPSTFYASLLKAMRDPEVPETPKNDKGQPIDSAWQWRYYKTHYWDSIDLKDDRMLRTPVFHNKLKSYFTRTVVQIPDSLNVACDDLLIGKSDPKTDIFKYMLVYFLNTVANSKIMGMDASYVYLVKNYYAKGYATWVDSAQLAKIVERGRILEPLLLGKRAQNISLHDTTQKKIVALNQVKAKYTVVCFWDPDCGHCKKEVPVLHDAYKALKAKGVDVEVYAPSTVSPDEITKWVDFVKEKKLDWINVADPYRISNFRSEWDIQSTPQIYILDKDKMIKAKRLGAEQIEDFILQLEDPNHKPKKPFVEDEDQKVANPH